MSRRNMKLRKAKYGLLIGALLLSGCSTLEKRLERMEALAVRFELEEGRIGAAGHSVSGEIRVTGGFGEDGKYRVLTLDGTYTNAVTGRHIYINGKRAKKK